MTKRKTIDTMDLKGNKYAKVKDRLLEFWTENPHGKIETIPTIRDDGRVLFAVRIVKDKSDDHSAEVTGHAIGEVGEKDKAFEKLETIAVGRALGLLGYASTGEIASSEEMDAFNDWSETQFQEKVLDWQEKMFACTALKELGLLWADMPRDVKEALQNDKDEMKKRLEGAAQADGPVADESVQAPVAAPKRVAAKKKVENEKPATGTLV